MRIVRLIAPATATLPGRKIGPSRFDSTKIKFFSSLLRFFGRHFHSALMVYVPSSSYDFFFTFHFFRAPPERRRVDRSAWRSAEGTYSLLSCLRSAAGSPVCSVQRMKSSEVVHSSCSLLDYPAWAVQCFTSLPTLTLSRLLSRSLFVSLKQRNFHQQIELFFLRSHSHFQFL